MVKPLTLIVDSAEPVGPVVLHSTSQPMLIFQLPVALAIVLKSFNPMRLFHTKQRVQFLHQAVREAVERLLFSNVSPRRENHSFYFAEQTGGKQHMPLPTELQNQN